MGMFQVATLLLFFIAGTSTPDPNVDDGLLSYPVWIIVPIVISLGLGAMMLMHDYKKERC